jgi:hypothetical protein
MLKVYQNSNENIISTVRKLPLNYCYILLMRIILNWNKYIYLIFLKKITQVESRIFSIFIKILFNWRKSVLMTV